MKIANGTNPLISNLDIRLIRLQFAKSITKNFKSAWQKGEEASWMRGSLVNTVFAGGNYAKEQRESPLISVAGSCGEIQCNMLWY